MPDDRARLARFAGEVRTDIPMGDRMLRFAAALQTRICREIEALETGARFRDEPPAAGAAGGTRVLVDGAIVSHARVAATSEPRDAGATVATGIALDLVPVEPAAPTFTARLHHLAPARSQDPGASWFEGAVAIAPAGTHAAEFETYWRTAAAPHVDLVDFDALCRAYAADAPRDSAGFRFDALRDRDGTAETAFLFVRDVGRALWMGWGASR
jgi:coproporphyrinogen III oxidase